MTISGIFLIAEELAFYQGNVQGTHGGRQVQTWEQYSVRVAGTRLLHSKRLD
jgi:hypothetical protein